MAILSFRDEATMAKNMPHTVTVHPGRVLLDELEERGISQSLLSRHMGILPKAVNEACRGKRSINAELAVRLSVALGGSPNFWMNLQANWELSQVPARVKARTTPVAAA